MDFEVASREDQIVTIDVGEALDFRNASEFKQLCKEEVDGGAHHFILNFSETGILDSTGLGGIFSLYRKVSPEDGQVVFAAVSRPVQVVVQLTRTYKVFQQFPAVEEAREALLQEGSDVSPRASEEEEEEEK
jgi:anti-sigma B factor antagonist